jgi:hypothetical protein
MATSIGTANTRITSVSDYAVALSATLATSIGNSNTNITTNANAITSINTVVANVSALTSVNAAAITSINTVLESDVSADSGTFNTLTVITSASVGGTFNVGGNVGIGTTSPAVKLDVAGSIRNAPDNSSYMYIGRYSAGYGGSVLNTSGGSTFLGLQIEGSEKMRIDSSGNVGIGVSTVDTALGTKLHVAGTIRTDTGSAGANPAIVFDHDNFADADANYIALDRTSEAMRFHVNASERMRIDSSGNVGIGTTSPASKAHIVGSSNDTVSQANANLNIEGTGGNGIVVGTISSSPYSSYLQSGFVDNFGTATYPISLNPSGGNVGIGTSSPAKQLHITKAAKADIGTLTDGATITPDFDANQNFSVTLGGNRTLANPSNIDAGQTGSIFVVQDGTGSRTLSFGSYWKFAGGTAPTLSTAAGSVDRIDYIVYTTTAIHAVATLNVS